MAWTDTTEVFDATRRAAEQLAAEQVRGVVGDEHDVVVTVAQGDATDALLDACEAQTSSWSGTGVAARSPRRCSARRRGRSPTGLPAPSWSSAPTRTATNRVTADGGGVAVGACGDHHTLSRSSVSLPIRNGWDGRGDGTHGDERNSRRVSRVFTSASACAVLFALAAPSVGAGAVRRPGSSTAPGRSRSSASPCVASVAARRARRSGRRPAACGPRSLGRTAVRTSIARRVVTVDLAGTPPAATRPRSALAWDRSCARSAPVPGVVGVRVRIEGGVPVGLFPGYDLRGTVREPVADERAPPAGVQQLLVDLGFMAPAGVTGQPGDETSVAVLAFQKWAGLPRTGALDARVTAALVRARRPAPRPPPARPAR